MDKLLTRISHGARSSNSRCSIHSGTLCGSCGSVAKSRIAISQSGCIVTDGQSNVCLAQERRSANETDISMSFGRPIRDKILATLRQTFGGRRMQREDSIPSLQAILADLKSLNGWLANRIKCNEIDYSYYKSVLELEQRKLEKNCNVLRDNYNSFIVLCNSAVAERADKRESEQERRRETVRLEAEVRRHEPALYHKYQALQRMPGNRDVILNAIRTSMTEKQAALEKMETLLGLAQRNKVNSEEQSDENPAIMLLPTKTMPMLPPSSEAEIPSQSQMNTLHFIYPMGADGAHDDFRGSFA